MATRVAGSKRSSFVARNTNPGGRPRKHATDAERQAAYRDRYAVFQVRLRKETLETIDKLAEYGDVPRTEVVNSLINFALLNRNWLTVGLFGKRLPHAYYDQKQAEREARAKGNHGDSPDESE